MPEPQHSKLHARDLRDVIEEAIRRLPAGESRLALSDFPLSYVCLSDFYGPNMSERLSSDYSIPSGNEQVEKQYFEEITTIEQIMAERDVPIGLAGWQSRSKLESVSNLMKGINRRAYAIKLWNWYAIPWRLDRQNVHVIYSPHDVMGTPIIHTYPAQDFLRAVAETMDKQHTTAESLNKKLSFWRNFSIIALVIICIVLYAIIQGLLSK